MNMRNKIWKVLLPLVIVFLVIVVFMPDSGRHYAHQGPVDRLINNANREARELLRNVEKAQDGLNEFNEWLNDEDSLFRQ